MSHYLPILGILVLACGPSVQAATINVVIDDLAFVPEQSHANVGDTIQWKNGDFVAHTATARNGAWDVMIAANGSAAQVLSQAGTIFYYCRFHPDMKGVITVSPN